MDKQLWQLIKEYGSWSFLAGRFFQKEVHGKDYDRYSKQQDDALDKIKCHLTNQSSGPDEACPECEVHFGNHSSWCMQYQSKSGG